MQKIRTANKMCYAVRIRIGLSGSAGKIQENRSGFLGRFKGSGGNRNPPGSKPQTSEAFAVWKGRSGHRGLEPSLAVARSVVTVSDAPYFLSRRSEKESMIRSSSIFCKYGKEKIGPSETEQSQNFQNCPVRCCPLWTHCRRQRMGVFPHFLYFV